MTIAIITVHRDKLPEMEPYSFHPETYHASTNPAANFIIHSTADIETIEDYRGPYQKEVRAMAAKLRELFPAEAEPNDKYILRTDDGKVVVCGDCGFLIETKWAPEHSQYQCKVCIDLRSSGGSKQMCHQTNVLLAALEKSRPEAHYGKFAAGWLNELRDHQKAVHEIAGGQITLNRDKPLIEDAFRFVASVLDSEVSDV